MASSDANVESLLPEAPTGAVTVQPPQNPMDAVRSAVEARKAATLATGSAAAPLPCTVLSGFLGAGKTTTLK